MQSLIVGNRSLDKSERRRLKKRIAAAKKVRVEQQQLSEAISVIAQKLNEPGKKPRSGWGHRLLRGVEIFALITVFLTVYATFVDLGGRQEQRITQAWQLITTKAPGNSGKAQALGYLNSEDWRSRWIRGLESSFGESVVRSNVLYMLLDNGIIPRKKKISLTGIDVSSFGAPAYLVGSKLQNSILREAVLLGADLERADLQSADLWMTNLKGASLYSANLSKAQALQTNFQDAEFSLVLYDSRVVLQADLRGIQVTDANFNGSVLAGIDLENIDFRGSSFVAANLDKSNLQGSGLGRSDARRASLKKANLSGANLFLSNLQGANLESSDLRSAYLFKANLNGANVSGAIFRREDFSLVLEPTFLPEEFMGDISRWHYRSGAVYLRGKPPVGLAAEDLGVFSEVECWASRLFELPVCAE